MERRDSIWSVGVQVVWGGGRNTLLETPWDGGIIPYTISHRSSGPAGLYVCFRFSSREKTTILRAIMELECLSCLQFVPRCSALPAKIQV